MKKGTYKEAVEALNRGLFPSVTACAKHFEVCHTTLGYLVKSGREFTGSGRQSSVFTEEEEEKKLVRDRLSLGCGLDFKQLCLCVFCKKIHPPEQLGFTENNEPSTARAMLNVSDLNHWFENVNTRFVQDPKFSSCFLDPRRIHNQEERKT